MISLTTCSHTRRLFLLMIVLLVSPTWAQKPEEGKHKGPPAAAVNVATVESGKLSPDMEFIGTAYFNEVSDVASEVQGKVLEIFFEAGQRLKKDQILVRLDAELLEGNLATLQAGMEVMQIELEQAQVDFEREKRLFKKTVSSERNYDNARFLQMIREKKVAEQQAQIARLKAELRKKEIRMPFDGVILERQAEVGRWMSEGATVAVIAREQVMDVLVDAPQRVLPFLHDAMPLDVRINSNQMQGHLFALIPRGDIGTRTFPVKIRLEDQSGILEGMEARVRLPVGEQTTCMLVPRDAIIPVRGQDTLYTVGPESKAVAHKVQIIGFNGSQAGVQAQDLKAGAQVIIKGQERMRPGQAVRILDESEAEKSPKE